MIQSNYSIFNIVKDIIYPNNCIICDYAVEVSTNCICNNCFRTFEKANLNNWIEDLRFSQGIDRVYSAWHTTGAINDIIHKIKYHNQPRLGEELGKRMADIINFEDISDVNIFTAVPLNSTKTRERGYNQSEWICKGLSKVLGIPYKFDLLKRVKNTNTQTDLMASERKINMENAFKTKNISDFTSIAIIDDVITTGATLSACAVELKKNGTEKIIGISCGTPQFGF